MNKQTSRTLVFSLFFASSILPVYLTLRFGWPEFLWLYVPILTFWAASVYEEFEENEKNKNADAELERRQS